MGVKIPVLSPPPPKDPKHCSPLPPGCYRKRAVRRAKKESPGPRGGSSRTEAGRTGSRGTIEPGRGSSSLLLFACRGQLVLQRILLPCTTMEVLEGRPGSVRAALQLASESRNIRLARGGSRATRPRLLRPLPARVRRLAGPSSAALRSVDRHLEIVVDDRRRRQSVKRNVRIVRSRLRLLSRAEAEGARVSGANRTSKSPANESESERGRESERVRERA